MQQPSRSYVRVIGIEPCTRGIGFAVLEGEGRLIDWGVARLYSKNDDEFLVRLEALVLKYRPDLLVAQELAASHRGTRAKREVARACEYAEQHGIAVASISKESMRLALGLAHRAPNHALAVSISALFPELIAHLPPARKPWRSESPAVRMLIAVSLAHLGTGGKRAVTRPK